MRNIRNLILLCGGGALAAYFAYGHWLHAIIEQVPQHVFELSFWTWILWAGWYLLQKISH